MKVTSKTIVFESQRERDIFRELLREIDMNDIRPEIHGEVVEMLDEILQGLAIYDEEAPR